MASDPKTRKSRRWILLVGGVMAVILVGTAIGIVIWQTQKSDSDSELIPGQPVKGYGVYRKAAVSCDAPGCSEIGKSMLERGGSVADAAIAALLCMGVIHSQSMGIGGGFLMIYYNATSKTATTLNARETAPGNAFEDMFEGNSTISQIGGKSVAVPGEIKGYWELYKRAGKLPWKDLFEPTIKICNEGFLVTKHTEGALISSEEVIKRTPSMAEIFINNATGRVFQYGDRIYRKKLGETLRKIADSDIGGDEFYVGETAKLLIEDLEKLDGIMTMDDLANYTVQWSEPINVSLHGDLTLHAVPPPGSGILMAFMMKVLDNYLFNENSLKSDPDGVRTYQRITETFKHAYAKRTSLGDPADEDVRDEVLQLVANLTSDSYIWDIRSKMHDTSTNNTYEYYGAKLYQPEDHGTAHISILSPNGDAIAVTSTVNLYFGAKIRSTRTGIIYNDEMDDFSAPNITNAFGVPPSPNNFIKPGKRPLSSMTPAIITDKHGNVRLTLGTAGGTKITTATTLVAIRNLWFDENIKTAIDAPRIHHQLYPMTLQLEKGFSTNYSEILHSYGHNITFLDIAGSVTCGIARYENGTIIANSDYRKGGTVAGF